MKMLIALCSLSFCLHGQEPSRVDTPISYVSKGNDTLYLVNDPIGKMVANVWSGNMYVPERDGRKPAIVFKPHDYILRRNGLVKEKKEKKLTVSSKKKLEK